MDQRVRPTTVADLDAILNSEEATEVFVNQDGSVGAKVKRERRYLPGLADLVDRLTIVNQKMIFLPENRQEYHEERELILHDIDLILQEENVCINAKAIFAITILALTNRFIWENESKAREGGNEQDQLLKLTHSINGVRAGSKNLLAEVAGGRKDYKLDCFAAELIEEFGNWNILE